MTLLSSALYGWWTIAPGRERNENPEDVVLNVTLAPAASPPGGVRGERDGRRRSDQAHGALSCGSGAIYLEVRLPTVRPMLHTCCIARRARVGVAFNDESRAPEPPLPGAARARRGPACARPRSVRCSVVFVLRASELTAASIRHLRPHRVGLCSSCHGRSVRAPLALVALTAASPRGTTRRPPELRQAPHRERTTRSRSPFRQRRRAAAHGVA